MTQLYTISEASMATGINYSFIYQRLRMGLLKPTAKAGKGLMLFSKADLEKIKQLKAGAK
jgi:DNA-binding transcriptional MerR regulator